MEYAKYFYCEFCVSVSGKMQAAVVQYFGNSRKMERQVIYYNSMFIRVDKLMLIRFRNDYIFNICSETSKRNKTCHLCDRFQQKIASLKTKGVI